MSFKCIISKIVLSISASFRFSIYLTGFECFFVGSQSLLKTVHKSLLAISVLAFSSTVFFDFSTILNIKKYIGNKCLLYIE